MAARRNKSQARRTSGGGAGGLPGWAWLVIGILATLVLMAGLIIAGVVSAPKFAGGSGDGFFRPQPNPDAEPAPVDADGEAIVPEGVADSGPDTDETPRPRKPGAGADAPSGEDAEYDFYTLLPGKEVPMTEAEIAATAQAETRRAEQARAQQTATAAARPNAMPTPVRDPAIASNSDASSRPATASASTPSAVTDTPRAAATPGPSIASAAPTTTPAPIGTDTRYLLQAGAFQASGQAEELKAKIAMLGLGARVESAQIQGKTIYRVRMGPYGTASDLSEAKRKLASSGMPGMAIKVD